MRLYDSNHFAVPADACATFKTLYAALEEYEKDLHQHIHLENNILFPKAVEIEATGVSADQNRLDGIKCGLHVQNSGQ